MKKFLIVSAGLALGSILLLQQATAVPVPSISSVAVINTHPTEAKYDKAMDKYAVGLKAALNEKDDKKAVALINKINNDLVADLEKIKPELERWLKGMTDQDKEALEERMGGKTYFKTIFELMFDPAVGARIEKSPELKQALEAGNAKMKSLGFESEEEEEID